MVFWGGTVTGAISQVVVDFMRNGNGLAGEFELYLSLWKDGFNLTEEFTVTLPFGRGFGTAATNRAVFRNVEVVDGMYLICRIVRLAPDLDDRKNAPPGAATGAAGAGAADRVPPGAVLFRRAFAVGAQPFAEALAAGSTAGMVFYAAASDTAFAEAPMVLSQGRADGALARLPAAAEVGVEYTVQRFAGLYDDVCAAVPAVAAGAVCNVMRAGKVPIPDPARNDLYVTLEAGCFAQGKSIEATALVRSDDGTPLARCIAVGSADRESQYSSTVWPGQTNVTWRETFRVRLPDERALLHAHLYVAVRAVSSKQDKTTPPFAFAFRRFAAARGALVPDGPVTLECYKIPSGTTGLVPVDAYLRRGGGGSGNGGIGSAEGSGDGNMGSSSSSSSATTAAGGDAGGATPLVVRKGESLTLGFTSFARVPNDSKIAAVLQWRECAEDAAVVETRLTSLAFAPWTEVVRFLPELLRAIFDIFQCTPPDAPLCTTCFTTLVEVIKFLVDERAAMYSLHRALVERFIDTDFGAYGSAYYSLLTCMHAALGTAGLLQCLKSLPLLLRFVVSSRLHASPAVRADPRGDTAFKQSLAGFFGQLCRAVAQDTSATGASARSLAMRVLDECLAVVAPFFAPRELAEVLVAFVRGVADSTAAYLRLRTQMLCRALAGPAVRLCDDTARVVLPLATAAIGEHIQVCLPLEALVLEYVRTCQNAAVLQESIGELAAVFGNTLTLVRQWYALPDAPPASELPPAASACAAVYRGTLSERQTTVLVFLGLFAALDRMRALDYPLALYQQQLYRDERVGTRRFLGDLLQCLARICTDRTVFPRAWFSLEMLRQQAVLQCLYYARDRVVARAALAAPATPDGDAEHRLLRDYLALALTLLARHRPAPAGDRCPEAAALQASWVDAPRYVAPLVAECFPLVPRRRELLPILDLALHLLPVCDPRTLSLPHTHTHVPLSSPVDVACVAFVDSWWSKFRSWKTLWGWCLPGWPRRSTRRRAAWARARRSRATLWTGWCGAGSARRRCCGASSARRPRRTLRGSRARAKAQARARAVERRWWRARGRCWGACRTCCSWCSSTWACRAAPSLRRSARSRRSG